MSRRLKVLMVITSSAMSFAGTGHKMEIKQQTHAQRQLLQALITPDGSMEESGHSGDNPRVLWLAVPWNPDLVIAVAEAGWDNRALGSWMLRWTLDFS